MPCASKFLSGFLPQQIFSYSHGEAEQFGTGRMWERFSSGLQEYSHTAWEKQAHSFCYKSDQMATQTQSPQPKLGIFATFTFNGRSLIFHSSSPLFFTGYTSCTDTVNTMNPGDFADHQPLPLYSSFITARNAPYKSIKASINYKTHPKYRNNNPVPLNTFSKEKGMYI